MPFKCITAAELYARDCNLKAQDVGIIQEWLKKQPHLPQVEDFQILIFLHSCYYQVERTKQVIENFFTIRSLCPEIYKALSVEGVKLNLPVACLLVLPKATPNNNAVVLIKLIDTKPQNFRFNDITNCGLMAGALFLHQKGFFDGAIGIVDAKGFSLGHLSKLNVNSIKYALLLVQEALPMRLKEIHIVNTMPIVNKVVTLIKPFLQEDLYNMLQFHPPNSEDLYKSVPKELLPEDLGGALPPSHVLNEENMNNILENFEFFDWFDGQKVDESKRVGKSKLVNDAFGVEGTFKKLEID